MNRKFSISFLLLLVFIILLASSCLNNNKTKGKEINPNEKQEQDGEAIKKMFHPNRLLVLVNKELSQSDKVFKASDFDYVNCLNVDNLTKLTEELIAKQNKAKVDNDWKDLQEHVSRNLLVDESKYLD